MVKVNTPNVGKTIGAVETAFDILEIVADNGATEPDHIVGSLDYSRSTIHYYLTTLEKHRFLVRTDDGYQLGFRPLHFGNIARQRHDFTGVVETEVEQLAEETEMTALLAVQQQARSVYLYQSSLGDTADRRDYLGVEQHLHSTTFGKVLLAYLPDEMRAAIIEQHGLPAVTAGAITDLDTLSGELSTIREQGFAHGSPAGEADVRSIAVPVVRDREKEAVGAIGIIGREDAIAEPGAHFKANRFAENPVTIVKRHAQVLRNNITE